MLGVRRRGFETSRSPATAALSSFGNTPVVSGSTGGGLVADGEQITRTGPAATKPSMIESFVGLGGVIDSGTNGSDFTRANWTKSFTDFSRWTYTNARTLSRGVSLLADNKFPGTGGLTDGRKTWYYDYGGAVKSEYRSCNFFVDTGLATLMQWKCWRLSHNANENDTQDPSWYTASWKNGSNSSFLNIFNQTTNTPQRDWTTWSWGEWVRREVWFRSNTPDGTANGTWRTKWTRVSDGTVLYDTGSDSRFTGLLFRGPTGTLPDFRYAIWQNYLGNETPSETQMRVYMDDIYMSASSATTGAFVRAEVWDASSSPTKRAICEIASIAGTDWTVKINKGTLTTLSGAYLAMFGDSDTDATATKVAL